MHVHSLGYRTDLVFARHCGCIEDRGDHLVVTTPENPAFHWGNFLLFDRPPLAGDAERWIATCRAAFAHEPRVRHVAIGWDCSVTPHAEAVPFVGRGFTARSEFVMTTTHVREHARMARDVSVQLLRTDDDWAAATALELSMRDEGAEPEAFAAFKQRQMAGYRRMAEQGGGGWFGAFLGRTLVAGLGLFVEDGVGRYQSVITHPDFRRRGICARLVVEAAREAIAALGARTLVMVAAEGEPAGRIYEAVGFTARERQAGVCRRMSD